MPEFQYNALPSPTAIRVLELHHTKPISCSVHILELENSPRFDALSYTWGDPRCPYLERSQGDAPETYLGEDHPIFCNKHKFMVRQNLKYALEMLSEAPFDSLGRDQPKFVWIDAICINQADLGERVAQVKLMSSIYRRAQSVIAWLGPEDDTISDAFTVISRLSALGEVPQSKEEVERLRSQYRQTITTKDFYSAESQRLKLGIEPLGHRHWLAWVALLHRPYFKRVWIVQEVTLARELVVVCGRHVIRWEELSTAMWFLVLTDWVSQLHPGMYGQYAGNDESVSKLFGKLLAPRAGIDGGMSAFQLTMTKEFTTTAKPYSLDQLLQRHRHTGATDPRDFIFAFQGIADRNRAPLLAHSHLIAPNYTMPVEKLFTIVTRINLESRGNLRILTTKEATWVRKLKSLPSWVPDYSTAQYPESLSLRGANCNWSACGKAELKLRNEPYDSPRLCLQGYFVDLVEEMSDDTTNMPDVHLHWAKICKVARGLPDYYVLHPEACPQAQTRLEVLWRTLIGDTFAGEHPAPKEVEENFLSHIAVQVISSMIEYKNYKSFRKRLRGRLHNFLLVNFDRSFNEHRVTPWFDLIHAGRQGDRFRDIMLRTVDAADEASKQARRGREETLTGAALEQEAEAWERSSSPYGRFRYEHKLTQLHRRIFRTKGGLLGFGPSHQQPGDEVWILAGGSTPMLLRRHGPTMELLGEAYVHGLMHGEVEDIGAKLEDLVLE